jgi:hypothetical protein
MACNSPVSKMLTKAVLEQTDELDELGGFMGDEQQAQYVRDVSEVVRKLRIAEKLIGDSSMQNTYVKQLKR